MEATKSIYRTLCSLDQLETSQVNMYNVNDRYRHPPYFRFRFKNRGKNDNLYQMIRSKVRGYKGNIDWTLSTKDDIKNFILIPVVFEQFLYNNTPFIKDNIAPNFENNSYENLIDNAIEDIPHLANLLAVR